MNTAEYLELVVKNIDCTVCGRCCPIDCAHLTENRCDIHPNQHEADPKYGACELGPIDLVLYRNIYCPPVIEVIEAKTGVKVVIDPNAPRFCEPVRLQEALQTEIRRE